MAIENLLRRINVENKILISPIFNYQLSYIRIIYWYYEIIKSKRFCVIQLYTEYLTECTIYTWMNINLD